MGSSLASPTHLVILLVVVLLLFGAKRVPEIGRSLGTGMREFKDSVSADVNDKAEPTSAQLPPPVPAAQAPVPSAFSAVEQTRGSLAPAGSDRDAEPSLL